MPVAYQRLKTATLFLFISFNAWSQVGISPRLLELDSNQINKSQAFRLYNFTDKAVSFDVEVNNWTMNESNQTTLIPSTEFSLDQWTIVNPLSFTVKAQTSQTIRLAFRPPEDIADGEYQTMLYFNQVITDDKPDTKQVKTKLRIGAAVYLQVGEQNASAVISAAHVEQQTILVRLNNTGNTHVRFNGDWYLWDSSPEAYITDLSQRISNKDEVIELPGLIQYDTMPTTPILAKQQRQLKVELDDLKFDRNKTYYLLLKGTLANQNVSQILTVDFNHSQPND